MNEIPVTHSTLVILVEDDPTLNTLILRLLQRRGFKTESFMNGESVLARPFVPDEDCLLLLDYSLPDMTGHKVIEILKERGALLPFAMITGHGDEKLAVEMMKMGAYDYIVKVGDIHEILPARVGQICERITEQRNLKASEVEKAKLQDQLRQSQKLEAIGQLAGGVAHDFNNLLGSIMGYAEIVRMKATGATEKQFMEKIIKAVNRAADLTRQLLTFARKTKVDFVTLDLHQSIRNVMGLLKHTIDPRIVMGEDFRAESAVIQGDTNLIENALLNLGINARDAMPDGGNLVFSTESVCLREQDPVGQRLLLKPGSYVKVSVRDTGTGIDHEILEKIFEPFYTTKGVGKGTGLGLASVYGCLQQHNGNIEVESEKGKGATFVLYLPSGTNTTITEPNADALLVEGHGNILFIDDEMAIGEIVKEISISLGYTCQYFNIALEGVEYFKVHHNEIDLILLDIIMPKLSGADCLRMLRAIDPKVNVVIVSGYGDEKARQSLRESGVKQFISKPFTAADISKVLEFASQGR